MKAQEAREAGDVLTRARGTRMMAPALRFPRLKAPLVDFSRGAARCLSMASQPFRTRPRKADGPYLVTRIPSFRDCQFPISSLHVVRASVGLTVSVSERYRSGRVWGRLSLRPTAGSGFSRFRHGLRTSSSSTTGPGQTSRDVTPLLEALGSRRPRHFRHRRWRLSF